MAAAEKNKTDSESIATVSAVAKTHQVKHLPEASLWTAHALGGGVLLAALLLIVFAKGPTRAQALAAAAQQGQKDHKN